MRTAFIVASSVLCTVAAVGSALPPIKRADVIAAAIWAAMSAFGWCALAWG